MLVNGRLLNGCTHHTPPLLANTTMRCPGRAPFTRPATASSAAGPPALARGIVVNSIEGSTATWGDRHDTPTRQVAVVEIAARRARRIIMHSVVIRRHSNPRGIADHQYLGIDRHHPPTKAHTCERRSRCLSIETFVQWIGATVGVSIHHQ